jgi:hypothetical protein
MTPLPFQNSEEFCPAPFELEVFNPPLLTVRHMMQAVVHLISIDGRDGRTICAAEREWSRGRQGRPKRPWNEAKGTVITADM